MADSFHLDDLVTPVTRQEAQASIYSVLATLGVSTTSWKPGAVVRTMIAATSVVFASLSELQARIARMGFLELSEGAWLRLVARYVYGVEAFDATFASGSITLTNGGGGVYSFDADDLIFANTITGKTYRNTTAVSLPAMSEATVAIAATEAGTDSTSGAGEIDSMVTVVLGVTCSNALPLTGTDEETDQELRTRCLEKLGALSPFGPWDAYAYAARSAVRADGSSIGINRLRIVKDGYGTVTTYLAGPSGAITGDANDPASDLGIANVAIQTKAAPLAVNAVVLSAANNVIATTCEVWMYNTSALSDDQIEDAINLAVRNFAAAQPIGGNVIGSDPGKIFVSALTAAIFDALPQIFRVIVTAPGSDVTFDPNEVAVAAAVTLTAVHQEPPPEGFGGSL